MSSTTDHSTKYCLTAIAGMGVAFGAWALYLGHNNALISSVFGFVGVIAGYIVGKKT